MQDLEKDCVQSRATKSQLSLNIHSAGIVRTGYFEQPVKSLDSAHFQLL